MATKLSTLVPSVELTNIILGYPRPQGLFAEMIFPVIETEKVKGTIRSYNKDFFMQHAPKRARGAGENYVPSSLSSTIPYQLDEYSLETLIDHLEIMDVPGYKAREVEAIMQKLVNGLEKNLADTLQNTASYDSGNSETVSTSTDKWGYYTSGGSDVLGQVEDARVVVADKIGVDPNTLILANNTAAALRQHPQLIEKIKYSQKGVVTNDMLKELFEVENIYVSKARYTTSPDSDFTKMYDECAILAYINPAAVASEDNASFGYTLRRKGFPMATDYMSPNGKINHLGATFVQQQIITCNQAAYLFKNVL